MSAQHTPAPWGYEPTSGAIFYADNDVEPLIASTNLECVSVEQGDADGRLIAAAPTMLDELEMLASGLHMLIRAIDEGDPISEIRFRAEDMKREAKVAIAKATGGAA